MLIELQGRCECAGGEKNLCCCQVKQSIALHFTDQAVLKNYRMKSVYDEISRAVVKDPHNVFTQNEVLYCILQLTLLLYRVILSDNCYLLLPTALLHMWACGWLPRWATSTQ